ncbi:MAG: hypothetical protein QM759_09690 [Terricaulis sp.]
MPNFNTLARFAKLAALLCFFLPWILVSCSGNELVHGSGWDMMTGHLHPSDQINGIQDQFGNAHTQEQMDKPAPEIYVIAAFAVIALGLVLSFAFKRRGAAATMLATSLLAIALSFGAFEDLKSQMNRQVERQERKHHNSLNLDLGDSVNGMVRIEKQEGFWATIIALVAAAMLSGATLTISARGAMTAAPTNDEED